MNKNLKLAIMLVAASILGSAATMMATSELQKKGVITDTYVLTKESKTTDDGFVRTASRPVDLSRDFTDVAENTINCVVSIKNYGTPQQNYYQGGEFIDPFEFFFGPGFGNARMRGRAVAESVVHGGEFLLHVFLAQTHHLKGLDHDLRTV